MHHRFAPSSKEGQRSISDQPRSGRPPSAITDDQIDRVETVVHEDPHATLDEIADEVGISHGSAHTILVKHL